MDAPKFSFRKAEISDRTLIQAWWNKPHVMEFWDNSPSMWANCEGFLQGNKVLFDYWIGNYADRPFCLILTSGINQAPPEHFIPWLESVGETWTIDFMIGEEDLLGKGLAHLALITFSKFIPRSVSALIIDPAMTNPRAAHVYLKAGFVKIAQFTPTSGSWKGILHQIMKMKVGGRSGSEGPL